MAVTTSEDGKGRIWKVPPPVDGPAARVALWPQVLTGRKLDSDRVVRLLPAEEWDRAAVELDRAGGRPALPFDEAAWHRREARTREGSGQWFAAAWHLGRLIDATPDDPILYLRRGRARLQEDKLEPAVADFSRVIDLKKESPLAWLERGHARLLGRQWALAVEDLSRAIDLDKNLAEAWHQRGYARAAQGQWDRAAADLAEAVQRPGASSEALSHQALVCLQLKDAEGYRKACRALIQHPAPPFDPNGFALPVWTCAVGPDAGIDLRPLLQGSLLRPEMDERSYPSHRAAAAALYRAGDFPAAARKCQDAISAGRQAGLKGTPTVWLLLAMSEHRIGKDSGKAREWLDKARDWIAAAHKAPAGGPNSGETDWDRLPWPERLALEQLLAEAEKLISGGTAKP
jgi:tetratricopeptide (TPR) repeat protein